MLVLLLIVAFATPASAGTVSYGDDCSARYYCTHEVSYTAAPGERNDVSVTRLSPDVVEIHDAGAPVRGCVTVDPHRARCTAVLGATEGGDVTVVLGDGDDDRDSRPRRKHRRLPNRASAQIAQAFGLVLERGGLDPALR